MSGSRQGDTYHPRQANGAQSGYPPPADSRPPSLSELDRHSDRLSGISPFYCCLGALHEHLNDSDRERRAENDRAR